MNLRKFTETIGHHKVQKIIYFDSGVSFAYVRRIYFFIFVRHETCLEIKAVLL